MKARPAYLKSIEKFPDLQSCLVVKAGQIDLSDINWEKTKTIEDADVCMFRVFAHLASKRAVISWLVRNDFEVEPDEIEIDQNVMRMAGFDGKGYIVNGYWAIPDIKVSFPFWQALQMKTFAKSYMVSVELSADGHVIGLHSTVLFY